MIGKNLRLFGAAGMTVTMLIGYKILYAPNTRWFTVHVIMTAIVVMICILWAVSEKAAPVKINRKRIEGNPISFLTEEWWEHFPTEADWMKRFRDMWE